MVVIDNPVNGYIHLCANSILELHEFAVQIGLKRCWFQNKKGKNQPHYDVNSYYFNKALKNGALLLNKR